MGQKTTQRYITYTAGQNASMTYDVIKNKVYTTYEIVNLPGTRASLNLSMIHDSSISDKNTLNDLVAWKTNYDETAKLESYGYDQDYKLLSRVRFIDCMNETVFMYKIADGLYADTNGKGLTAYFEGMHLVIQDSNKTKRYFNIDTGKLASIKDKFNDTIEITYNASNKISTVKDAHNRIATFGYNDNGRLTNIVSSNSHNCIFSYDSNNTYLSFIYYGITTKCTYTSYNGKSVISKVECDTETINFSYSNSKIEKVNLSSIDKSIKRISNNDYHIVMEDQSGQTYDLYYQYKGVEPEVLDTEPAEYPKYYLNYDINGLTGSIPLKGLRENFQTNGGSLSGLYTNGNWVIYNNYDMYIEDLLATLYSYHNRTSDLFCVYFNKGTVSDYVCDFSISHHTLGSAVPISNMSCSIVTKDESDILYTTEYKFVTINNEKFVKIENYKGSVLKGYSLYNDKNLLHSTTEDSMTTTYTYDVHGNEELAVLSSLENAETYSYKTQYEDDETSNSLIIKSYSCNDESVCSIVAVNRKDGKLKYEIDPNKNKTTYEYNIYSGKLEAIKINGIVQSNMLYYPEGQYNGKLKQLFNDKVTYNFGYATGGELSTIKYDKVSLENTIDKATDSNQFTKMNEIDISSNSFTKTNKYDLKGRLVAKEENGTVRQTLTYSNTSNGTQFEDEQLRTITDNLSGIATSVNYNTKVDKYGKTIETTVNSVVLKKGTNIVLNTTYDYLDDSSTQTYGSTVPVGRKGSDTLSLSAGTYTGRYNIETNIFKDSFNRLSRTSQLLNKIGLEYLYTYDNKNRLDKVEVYTKNNSASALLEHEIFTYDNNGNIKSAYYNNGRTISYDYDGFNRLVTETNGSLQQKYVYDYDDYGNIKTKTTYKINTSTVVEKLSYKYEDPNRKNHLSKIETLTETKSCVYNDRGCPETYLGKVLQWTKGTLLTKYNNTTSFTYDANGQRYYKGNNTSNYSDYYYSDGRLTVEERKVNGVNNTIRYLYNATGIYGFTLTNPTNRSVYYYLKNVYGDIIGIYDHTGALVGRYYYDAWGNATVSVNTNGIADFNAIRYRGYYFDKETGLYYLNSRYYDPYTGRFISPDSYQYLEPDAHAGLNLYAYCYNNPVMYIDPSGHFVISILLTCLIVGAIAGATVGGVVAYNIASSNGAEGWDLFGWTMLGVLGGGILGGALGATIGQAIPIIGSFLSSTFTIGGGGLALAGGGAAATAAVTVTAGEIALGLLAVGALGIAFMAKDPFIKYLERGMTENQKQKFSEEIHELKRKEGRGGADNLLKEILEEIAEWVKRTFK